MKRLLLLMPLLCSVPLFAQDAFRFNGTNSYVTFGTAAGLGSNTFTLEAWFWKDAGGVTTTSGTGGIASVIPIISKGRGESDGSIVDMNYLFGISGGKLCADFEEGTGQPSPGLNHPVYGTTVLKDSVWYHGAATYDGIRWKLYLNGVLDATDSVARLPQSLSTQHAGIATALTSTGAPAGYFKGMIDEVRIWNYARSRQSICDSANLQLSSTTTGLVGRWGLNDVSGTGVAGSGTSGINGTRVNTPAPVTPGSPYNMVCLPPNFPPDQPTAYIPTDSTIYADTVLGVTVTDPDMDSMKVIFMGRERPAQADSPKFTILPIPDTQFYTSEKNGGKNATFKAQTAWINNNIATRRIAYAIQLGDCVENGDNGGNDIEWKRADTAMRTIEIPAAGMPNGLPYGICIGNHDQSPQGSATGATVFYNQYFGTARFAGRGYYGGHYGSNNDNHYQLFSTTGYGFIAINLEYDTNADTLVIRWADSLLKAYPTRRGIISSHWLINSNGTWGAQGLATYNRLKNNANLDFMLCGHINPNGEARRTDTFAGNVTHTLLSDYQDRTAGGNGWLRIMEFDPARNEVNVSTYSPTLNQFETDANSQFTLPYAMTTPFDTIGVVTRSLSGSSPKVPWAGLVSGKQYEWYTIVSDSQLHMTTSPIMSFTYVKPTGTNEVTGKGSFGISVFPNPIDGKSQLTVKTLSPASGKASVTIVDASGLFLGRVSLTNGEAHIDMESYPAGLYLLQYRDDVRHQTVKVTKY